MTHWDGMPDNYHEYSGFIYLVINNITGKKYIGRKYFYKRVKRVMVESDWKTYLTSSVDVKADIKKYKKENFSFKVIALEYDRVILNFLEVKLQMDADVLYAKDTNGEPAYYNKNIMAKYFQPADFGTDDYKRKCNNISSAIKNLYASGYVHPMQGKEHPSKGKDLPQTAPKNPATRNKFWYTNGETNLAIACGEEIPDGFIKGLTKRKEYVNSLYQKAKMDYELKPNMCEVCQKPISFKSKANKTCSKKCQLLLQSKKMLEKIISGEHCFSKINNPKTDEYKSAKEKASLTLKKRYEEGTITHPLQGKEHPCKGKKRSTTSLD